MNTIICGIHDDSICVEFQVVTPTLQGLPFPIYSYRYHGSITFVVVRYGKYPNYRGTELASHVHILYMFSIVDSEKKNPMTQKPHNGHNLMYTCCAPGSTDIHHIIYIS